jgi:NRPS condensation-like uncharacterized protein
MSLDNAAKIYPSVMGKELSSVFRIECRLTHPVKIAALTKAVEKISPRFPYYLTTLRQGLFWFFLQYAPELRPPILADEKQPCVAFPAKKGRNTLFRIVVYNNRLSVEFLHVLGDGGAAMEYFRTLLVTYFNHLENSGIPFSEGILDPGTEIQAGESEDSFNKYYDRQVPWPDKTKKAWHLPFALHSSYKLEISSLQFDTAEVKSLAKEFDLTITEFLISVYLYSLQEIWKDEPPGKKPIIRVQTPVNMRAKLESISMRNFSLFVTPEIDMRLGSYSFDEICRLVYHYMKQRTELKILKKTIARNVKPEKKILLRIVPLFLKNFIMAHHYKKDGASRYSGVLTNLGLVKMPEEADKYIESFHFFPPPPTHDLKVSCGLVSYKNKMTLTFANITKKKELERRFVGELTNRGIKVKLLNNPVADE